MQADRLRQGFGVDRGKTLLQEGFNASRAQQPPVAGTRLERAADALRSVGSILDDPIVPDGFEELAPEDVEQLIDATLHRLSELLVHQRPNGRIAELAMSALRLSEIRREFTADTYARLLNGLRQVQHALARLRAIQSTEEMIAQAPRILCDHTDFTTVALLRFDADRVVPASMCDSRDQDILARVRSALRDNPVVLQSGLLETEMLRRRRPILVHDAYHDPRVASEIFKVTSVRSYVAAPILPQGRVIGFLHAARPNPVDIVDRDLLWSFAEGYGYALARTMLLERLSEQGARFRDLVHATDGLLAELHQTDLQIIDESAAMVPAAQASPTVSQRSPIYDILTRREVEVVELMAQGDTNKQIAARMIVSTGTVKSHVHTILRKLKAANRAEAVSHFVRMTGDSR
jgi:DNA-binding CsgD family transcriptional regulator